MLKPDRLLRIFVEIIFVLLGGLLAWLGVTGQLLIRVVERRHDLGWQLAGGLLIARGAIGWFRAGSPQNGNAWLSASLGLLGILMLAISFVPFLWVGRLLISAGGLLILRGLVGSVIVSRQS